MNYINTSLCINVHVIIVPCITRWYSYCNAGLLKSYANPLASYPGSTCWKYVNDYIICWVSSAEVIGTLYLAQVLIKLWHTEW